MIKALQVRVYYDTLCLLETCISFIKLCCSGMRIIVIIGAGRLSDADVAGWTIC